LNGVELDFIRLGKPTDNALIEDFNGRFREECLNESWLFISGGRQREGTGMAAALQPGETAWIRRCFSVKISGKVS
jgi:transposase InsO family protein